MTEHTFNINLMNAPLRGIESFLSSHLWAGFFIGDNMEIPYGYCHCGCGQLAPIAKVNNAPKGIIKGKPFRFIVGHSIRIRQPGPSFPNWKGGISKHGSYYIWHHMMKRCYKTSDPEYKNYGGRGIKVCDEWQDILNFIKWAKNNNWNNSLEIDRINNNKGYSPDNCRFVNRLLNAQNTRASKIWHIKGKTYPSLRTAAKELKTNTRVIIKMCDGITDHNYHYPPEPGCWSKKLYKEN